MTRLGPPPSHCAQAVAPRSPRAAFSALRETSLIEQNCSAGRPPAWGDLFGVGDSKSGEEEDERDGQSQPGGRGGGRTPHVRVRL